MSPFGGKHEWKAKIMITIIDEFWLLLRNDDRESNIERISESDGSSQIRSTLCKLWYRS